VSELSADSVGNSENGWMLKRCARVVIGVSITCDESFSEDSTAVAEYTIPLSHLKPAGAREQRPLREAVIMEGEERAKRSTHFSFSLLYYRNHQGPKENEESRLSLSSPQASL